ncbi:MAG: hypothetical protein SF123_09305 [Chloroflexota bacterium]|nr:hypothetical protein [Chloroflexota bacterium]
MPQTDDMMDTLRVALETDSVNDMLVTLLTVAENRFVDGNKAQSFAIVALLREYPMPEVLAAQVEMLFDELEFQLCPRVVADAKARALEITLEEIVLEVLNESAR